MRARIIWNDPSGCSSFDAGIDEGKSVIKPETEIPPECVAQARTNTGESDVVILAVLLVDVCRHPGINERKKLAAIHAVGAQAQQAGWTESRADQFINDIIALCAVGFPFLVTSDGN